jgi:hypothetical protein
MIRKFKFIGLALVAVFAMSAVAASAASAAEIKSESAPVKVTGSQEGTTNGFDVTFGEVKCTTADYNTETVVTADKAVTLTPTFDGCTFAGVATEVDINECKFELSNITATSGTVKVVCPGSNEITVTNSKCVVHVPSQDAGTVTLATIGTTTTREITASLGGLTTITYSQTPGSGVGKCPAVSESTGAYTGTSQFTGETTDGKTHVGLFIA